MSERLAEMESRMQAVRELGLVVNAMRGMAASRLEQARGRLSSMRMFADVVESALDTGLALEELGAPAEQSLGRRALVLFCAEQGFAGAFTERVLDAASDLRGGDCVVLVGTRGRGLAAERGHALAWSTAMPARVQGIARLADQIVERLAPEMARGALNRLEVVFSACEQGLPLQVCRDALLPLTPRRRAAGPPLVLTQLAPRALLLDFIAEHLHAQICYAALRSFEAEAQARMEAMAAARRHIDRELANLQVTWQQARQEDITAEIIELAAGKQACLPGRP
jgi:F-type H+-transporting ATPase subunit gamma